MSVQKHRLTNGRMIPLGTNGPPTELSTHW